MSARVALVATSTADEPADLLDARLAHLRSAGWQAELLRTSPFDSRLRRSRFELAHFHSAAPARRALDRGRLGDTAVVLSPREDGCDLAGWDPAALWQRCAAVVVAHRSALERVLERGCPESRVRVLHAPVPEQAARREPRNGRLRLLSAGPLVWEHGLEHSIHAVRLLLDMGVECDYTIIGDGAHIEAVAFARHQLGLEQHVRLLGHDPGGRLAAELGRADVFVDSAVTSTLSPTATAAARAHGIPCVSTNGGELSVRRRDPDGLAAAIARLAGEPGLLERLGEQAARKGTSPTAAEHGRELERIYLDALAVR